MSELTVSAALQARQSVREFEDTRVPEEELRELFANASRAPSSKNTQPWEAYVLRGARLEALRKDYLEAFDAGEKPQPPYSYSPSRLPEHWMARARQVGYTLFEHKGIARDDKERRRLHDRENFHFFGAPQVLFLATDGAAERGTFFDCGLFLSNVMLGLAARGYGCCPMFSAVAYPQLLSRHIPKSEGKLFICGLPFGVAKTGSHVNEFRTIREPVEQWFTLVDD